MNSLHGLLFSIHILPAGGGGRLSESVRPSNPLSSHSLSSSSVSGWLKIESGITQYLNIVETLSIITYKFNPLPDDKF